MKPLDIKRHPIAHLADPSHRLPMLNGRLFGDNPDHPGHEHIDLNSSFDQMLIAGGSVILGERTAPATAAAQAAPAHSGVEADASEDASAE